MLEFSRYLERKIRKKAFAKGFDQGFAIGFAQGKALCISQLFAIKAMTAAGMALDDAIEYLNIPEDNRSDYKEILS